MFTLIASATYYVAGGAFLVFASLCAICELTAKGRRVPLLYVALGATLPYVVGVLGFDMSAPDAYTRLLPISWRVLRYGERSRLLAIPCVLYLLPPLAMASGVAWRKLRPRLRPDRTRPATSPCRHVRRSRLRWVGQTLALLGIGVAAGFAGFDPKEKTRFAVDYHAYHRNWPQVLTAGKHHPDHRVVMHAVNRALYHSGRLGDEMFRWPQSPGSLFLIGTGHEWVHWQSFDVHLEMGLVNLAEHSLTESLAKLGDRPMVLQRLALVHLVKKDTATARIYLETLSRTLFHGQWAKHYLTLLDHDPNLSTDGSVQHLRSLAMQQDFPLLDLSKEQLLSHLLEANPGNRMALEYLMAWHLLNGQLAQFVPYVSRLGEMGYRELPTHFEEATLLYVYGTKRPLEAGEFSPDARLQQRIGHISQILERHAGDQPAARAEMAKYHRDTYFFYYLYLRPGQRE